MKICEKCGVEIINGVNGCMMTGAICFDCGDRPYYGPSGVASIPAADTALISLDNRELFMNNSEVVAVLKKGDFLI